MKTKKIIRTLSAILLITGITATVGFLSFTGMLLITPIIAVAGASFFFAVAIEGEVYTQNILSGLKKLLKRDYIQKKVVERELDALITQEENVKQSQFLTDYQNQKKYVKKLRKNYADKKIVKEEETRLKLMQAYFKEFIYSAATETKDSLAHELHSIIDQNERLNIQKEIARKKIISKSMWSLYILGGVSCTFASIYSIQVGFLTLIATIGPTLLLGGILPLAVLAGIGYAITLYENVNAMICNDTVQKCAEKIKKYFRLREGHESKFIYVLRISAVGTITGIVVSLGIFATIATAGTWWIAAKEGARLIPFVSNFATGIRNLTIPAMFIPNLIYNIKNSFKTIKKIGQFSIKEKIHTLVDEIEATKKQETLGQLLNPFRLVIKAIEFPLKFLAFIAHLVSICVTSDHLDPIPPTITAGLNCTNEALVDAHFFMETHHAHKEQDHQHGILVNVGLKFILSPLYSFSAVWAYAFRPDSDKNKEFYPYLLESFGQSHKNQNCKLTAPVISSRWKQQEIMMKLNNKIAHYDNNIMLNNKIAQEKKTVFIKLKDKISQLNVTSTPSNEKTKPLQQILSDVLTDNSQTKTPMEILGTHRNSFFTKKNNPPNSKKFVNEILENDGYKSLCANYPE